MHRSARRLAVLLTTGSLLTGMMSLPADAAPRPTALITGTITELGGAPARGATVVLRAWPRAAILDAAPAGPVDTPVTATAVTDSLGRYELSPNLSSLAAAEFREAGGSVSFSEQVWDGRGDMMASDFSLARPAARDAALPAVGSAAAPLRSSFDLSRGTVTTRIGSRPPSSVVGRVQLPAPDVRAALAAYRAAGAAASGGICQGWSKGSARYAPQRERFYNLYSYGRVEVAEEAGSSHSLGVAYEASVGGWGAHASITLSTTASAGGDVTYQGNHTLYNEVNEHKFNQTCHTPPPGSPCKCPPPPTKHWHNHEIRVTGFHDLQTDAPKILPRAWTAKHACTPRTKGRFTKTRGADQEFSAGLSTPVGISLEARAGYSHNYSVTWTVTKAKGEWMCGSTSAGFAGAPFAGGTDPHPRCDGSAARVVRSENGDAAPLAGTAAVGQSSAPPVCN